MSLKVMGLPTFMFYKGGECRERLSGDEVTLEAIKAAAVRLLA
jgi:thioredoxin 1